MSGRGPAGAVRAAAADAVPRLVASGIAGPLAFAGARNDQRGVRFDLQDAAGALVAIRVEVGPLAGRGAQTQAASRPDYQVIRLSDRADPRAVQALLAGRLEELRAARELAAQPGDLLVPGTAIPDQPRLTLADRAHLADLSRLAAVMTDPRRGTREREAASARFSQLAVSLGLRPALPGDGPAVRARQGIAAAALDPAAAAALRGSGAHGRQPAPARPGASRPPWAAGPDHGGQQGRGRAASPLLPYAVALPVLVAAAQRAQAVPAGQLGRLPGGLPARRLAIAGPQRRELAPGAPRRPGLAAGLGRGLPGNAISPSRALAAAVRATPGAQDGPELEL